MLRFAFATLIPVLLLAIGALLADGWIWAAFIYMSVLVFWLDHLRALGAIRDPGVEFPAGTGLSVALALAHFGLLGLGVWLISGGSDAAWHLRILGFFAFGLFFGQVSNSNAHELIHRTDRRLRWLGVAVYASVFYGHHASAHPLVHHVHVATRNDPNSPRPGESFYLFARRAWFGEYRAGREAETARRRSAGKTGLHPYRVYALLSLASALTSLLIGGPAGLAALLGLAFHTQVQHLGADYVQHYGLFRAAGKNGKFEPCGPHHSWNSPHLYSSALMLNAPRHSDHHMRPGIAYPGLRLAENAWPTLPYSLPVMAAIALWPARWRRIMDRRAATWAAPRERAEL